MAAWKQEVGMLRGLQQFIKGLSLYRHVQYAGIHPLMINKCRRGRSDRPRWFDPAAASVHKITTAQ